MKWLQLLFDIISSYCSILSSLNICNRLARFALASRVFNPDWTQASAGSLLNLLGHLHPHPERTAEVLAEGQLDFGRALAFGCATLGGAARFRRR